MPCPTFSDLEAFHSKSLSPERLDAILDHASTCDTCYDLLSSSMDAVQEEALGREVREVLQLSKLAGEPECTAVIEKILQGFLAQESLRDGSTNHHFLEAGSRFGDFRIKRLIARGGMGVVYAAEQISLERDVALKVLVSGQPLTDRKLQRFRNEALALARLDHHHIVPVLAFGEERGFNYLVMRLIEGIDLAKVIQQLERANPGRGSAHSAKTVAFKEDADLQAEGKERTVEFELTPIASDLTGDFEKSALEFPVDIFGSSNISDVLYIKQILKQFARLADALQYSHDRGIIHRDIKPSNILVDRTGILHITDFGIAKLDDELTMTATQQFLGTPRYMSPEQIPGNRGFIDHRTDIYSLGITLYELLTLNPAFAGGSLDEVFLRIRDEQPLNCRIHNPAISRDLETVILKSIEKSSSDRYDTAGDLAADLLNVVNNRPIRAKRAGLSTHFVKLISRNHRASAAIAAGVAGLLLMCFVMLAVVTHANQEMEVSEKRVRESLDKANVANYSSSFALAFRNYLDRDFSSASRIMTADRFITDGKDYRGIEWDLLMQSIKGDSRSVQLSDGALYCIAVSHDRATFAVAGIKAVIYLIDVTDFSVKSTIPTEQIEINDLDFSDDDSRLVSAGDDGTICVWRCSDGERLQTIPAYDRPTYFSRFLNDNRFVVSHDRREMLQIWNTETGENRELSHHADHIEVACLNQSKRLVASVAHDRLVVIEDLGSERVLLNIPLPVDDDRVTALAFSPDDKFLYVGGKKGSVIRIDLLTRLVDHVANHWGEVTSISFSQDGSTLSTSDIDGLINTFKITIPHDQPIPVHRLIMAEERWKLPGLTRPGGLDVTRDGKWACFYHHEKVCFLNLETDELQRLEFPGVNDLHDEKYRRVEDEDLICFSPDGKWLAFLADVYHLEEGEWAHHTTMSYPPDHCFALKFLTDNRTLAISKHSGLLDFGDAFDGTYESEPFPLMDKTEYPSHQSDAIAVSTDDRLIAVNAFFNDIWVYDRQSKRQSALLRNGNKGIIDMDFSADGSLLAVVRYDSDRIRFWHMASTEENEFHEEVLLPGLVYNALEFSPNGRWLAAATQSGDGMVYLWDIKTRKIFWQQPVSTDHVAFSADSRKLFTLNLRTNELGRWDLTPFESESSNHEVPPEQAAVPRPTSELINTSLVRDGEIFDVVSQPGGDLISVGENGRLTITPNSVRAALQTFTSSSNSSATGVRIHLMAAGSNRLIMRHDDGQLVSYAFQKGRLERIKEISSAGTIAVALSRDGNCLLTGTSQGNIESRDPESLQVIQTWQLENSPQIKDVRVSRDGKYAGIAVNSREDEGDDYLILLNLKTGEQSLPCGPGCSLDCFAFANQHDWLSFGVGTSLITLRLDDQSKTIWPIPKGNFRFMDYSPSDDLIASSGLGRQIILWDTVTGEEKSPLVGLKNEPREVRFTPDGRTLVALAGDNQLWFWNVETKLFLMYDDYFRADTFRLSPGIPGIITLRDGETPVVNYLDYDWKRK